MCVGLDVFSCFAAWVRDWGAAFGFAGLCSLPSPGVHDLKIA